MHIPETPDAPEELDLLKRLKDYSTGSATYLDNGEQLGKKAKMSCAKLHSDLVALAIGLSPLLDKTNSREMELFTMHDARHARKVAHLMWHILTPEQQERLTPPEIGLMVGSAYFHDLGMFLSPADREKLLEPDSKLWEKSYAQRASNLGKQLRKEEDHKSSSSSEIDDTAKFDFFLVQSYEAILCRYVREEHASIERYSSLTSDLRRAHERSRSAFPDIDACLSFDGQSFISKMIAVCVSHNQSEQTLISMDINAADTHEFSREYPVGSSSANLLMVACALRLADILDFDRERTPEEIFQYFISGRVEPEWNRSALEWEKHLSISNWQVDSDEIQYKIRCSNHIVHHAILKFCTTIEDTISATHRVCSLAEKGYWPFILPSKVKPIIHEEGYRYLPFRFTLDDERIYDLLMGSSIYKNPLDAVRELVQNSVDACALRDALIKTENPSMIPNSHDRIIVHYLEPRNSQHYPLLKICDSGTGMDERILTDHFLKVGSSYYTTEEFAEIRAKLWKAGSDFAPVSDFGIGFLSCFLLGDQIRVETSMWENLHGDIKHRILDINGPSRLIRLEEKTDTSVSRFKGTSVSIQLLRGSPSDSDNPPSYNEVAKYLRDVCFCLPYEITLVHESSKGESRRDVLSPKELVVDVPLHLEEVVVRIPVEKNSAGLTGEIVLFNPKESEEREIALAKDSAIHEREESVPSLLSKYINRTQSDLIRGGFKIGSVPGLPDSYVNDIASSAVLALGWENQDKRRYPVTSLSRDAIASESELGRQIGMIWVSWLISNVTLLKSGFISNIIMPFRERQNPIWLEKFNGLEVYELAKNGWYGSLLDMEVPNVDTKLEEWEAGTGSPLPLGGMESDLYRTLLKYLLPRICDVSLIDSYMHVSAPVEGWKKILRESRDYVSVPAIWELYIEYQGRYEEHILYVDADLLKINSRYRKRIEEEFTSDEVSILIDSLAKLVDARQMYQVPMSMDAIRIMLRAQNSLGELEVASSYNSRRIDSFCINPVGEDGKQ